MNARSFGLAVALSSVLALAPQEARAQGIGAPADWGGLAALAVAGGVVVGGVVVGGFVADGMVLHDLAGGQGVRRGPAIAGTTLWGISSAVMLPVSVAMLSSDNADPGLIAAMLISDAVVFGSLALSIYGLTRPPPAPAVVAPWGRRMILHPTVVATQHGLAPGAGITLSL